MPKTFIDIANKSGFPLQIAAANEIGRIQTKQGWKVLFTEHAWNNNYDGRNGFIDLVVKNRANTIMLVIECKRTLDASWVFLCPSQAQLNRRHCKSWISAYRAGSVEYFGWDDLQLEPTTPESEFCVVRNQSKDRPMLERIASETVSATEAFAGEQHTYMTSNRSHLTLYFNVILTTAKLQVVQFDPDTVSLDKGMIPGDAKVTEVPVVRFRKQLSTEPPKNTLTKVEDARDLAQAKQNTVLIVHAELLRLFLDEFEVDNTSVARFIQTK